MGGVQVVGGEGEDAAGLEEAVDFAQGLEAVVVGDVVEAVEGEEDEVEGGLVEALHVAGVAVLEAPLGMVAEAFAAGLHHALGVIGADVALHAGGEVERGAAAADAQVEHRPFGESRGPAVEEEAFGAEEVRGGGVATDDIGPLVGVAVAHAEGGAAAYSRAAAPEMISVSSVVICAWRARL